MPLLHSPGESMLAGDRCVLVCQNRTCISQGAKRVLQAFQAHQTSAYTLMGTGCMGQCGNGPIVRVMPEDVWYCHVLPEEVAAIVERHLLGGKPIQGMTCPHVIR